MTRAECPVCRSVRVEPFVSVAGLEYRRCPDCHAIGLGPEHYPDPEQEAAHYRLHQNRIDDAGYRRFLSTLATPLLQRLPPARSGLDFGCGPGPALACMLRDAGHSMAVYDPMFFPDDTALASRYDFVTCSEVSEHFHAPATSFARLFELLRPRGSLAVMTGFPPQAAALAGWHYRRDPTHVVFYAPETFHWLARQHGAQCEIPCRNVALLRLNR
ncbi:MAG: class I SAM-dependent methyltransferase [Pseudomonadota bacterium]|nr:class I SAM-dependent methyltransferase [Pseudomonadota bacterium]